MNLTPLLDPFAHLLTQNFPFSQHVPKSENMSPCVDKMLNSISVLIFEIALQAPSGSERQKRNADTAFNTPTDMESTKMSDDIPLPMLSERDEVVNLPHIF